MLLNFDLDFFPFSNSLVGFLLGKEDNTLGVGVPLLEVNITTTSTFTRIRGVVPHTIILGHQGLIMLSTLVLTSKNSTPLRLYKGPPIVFSKRAP